MDAVMRGWAVVAIAITAGCHPTDSYTPGCSTCDAGDGGIATMSVQLIDDSAADFGASGFGIAPEIYDVVITDRGTIEPDAFVFGGLHARAYPQQPITSTTTWASLTAALPAVPDGERYAEVPIDWGSNWPRDLGLSSNNSYTIVYDGEINSGITGDFLNLTTDGNAFMEVSASGITFAGAYADSTDGDNGAWLTNGPLGAGWVQIRGAFTHSGGNASMILASSDPDTGQHPVDPSLLRARVTTAPGLLVSGFSAALLSGLLGTALDPGPIDHAWGTALPTYDLASSSSQYVAGVGMVANAFSLRYAGQVLIDSDGMYSFATQISATAGESYRLAIDGVVIASEGWPEVSAPSPSAPIHLAPGWHDLELDYSHDNDNASGLTLQIAPAGSPFATIAATHLRPATAFANDCIYLSSPRAITGALHIDRAMVTSDPPGTWLEVRSGADVDGVMPADWYSAGAIPPAPANVLQYRFLNFGGSFSSISKVEIDYTVPASPQ